MSPTEKSTASAPKKRNIIDRRRWTPDEDKSICEKLRDTILNGGIIEQPTARIYYEKMATDLKLTDVNHIKLKAKVLNLKKSYMSMVEWRSKTGQGVLEIDGEESVKAYILSKCPLFDILYEVFAARVNVNPPFLVESGTVENTSTAPDHPSYDVENDNPLTGNETSVEPNEPNMASTDTQEVHSTGQLSRLSRKRRHSDGLSALAEIHEQRVNMMQVRIDSENKWREQQLELENKKLQWN